MNIYIVTTLLFAVLSALLGYFYGKAGERNRLIALVTDNLANTETERKLFINKAFVRGSASDRVFSDEMIHGAGDVLAIPRLTNSTPTANNQDFDDEMVAPFTAQQRKWQEDDEKRARQEANGYSPNFSQAELDAAIMGMKPQKNYGVLDPETKVIEASQFDK